MISEENNKKIINYLLSKKIPIDVLVEVHDHICSQIMDNYREKNDFDVVFDEVKKTWEKDLKLNKDIWLGTEQSGMVRRIYISTISPIFIRGLLFGLLVYLCVNVMSLFFRENFIQYFILGVYFCWLIYMGIKYFSDYKEYARYKKKYDEYRLSVYDDIWIDSLPISFSFISIILQIGIKKGAWFFLNHPIESIGDVIYRVFVILLFILFIAFLYTGGVTFNKSVETIDKIKNYFPHLRSNRFYK